jgi:16S rRNA (guanine527-N7)-methyltransferase
MIDTTLLADGARALGVELSATQIAQFAHYADRLIEWNRRFNLTSIADPRDIVIKHFLDSLSTLRSIPPQARRVIDVGAGAGLPGIPIKLARPNVALTLLEATRKKCAFLEAMVAELELAYTSVVNARAEEAGRNRAYREHYDVAIARAVADLPALAEYLLPLVKLGGVAIAQKSREAQAELDRADTAILLLGGLSMDVVPVQVPGLNDERSLIVIEKLSLTPEEYPRRAGLPAKKPIS